MASVSRILKKDVHLPETLDVLFHLPLSPKLRKKGFIIAHAIQYNVCVKATSHEAALQKLADGVISRCTYSLERGVHPTHMAPDDYMKAFFMGTPIKENKAMSEILRLLTKELTKKFNVAGKGGITIEMRMRSVANKQKKLGLMRISDLVADAA